MKAKLKKFFFNNKNNKNGLSNKLNMLFDKNNITDSHFTDRIIAQNTKNPTKIKYNIFDNNEYNEAIYPKNSNNIFDNKEYNETIYPKNSNNIFDNKEYSKTKYIKIVYQKNYLLII